MNVYEILGISQNATEDEVKAAYRALAQKYSGPEYQESPMKEEAEQKMEEINAAFDQVMGELRNAQTLDGNPMQGNAAGGQSHSGAGKWSEIRALINAGNIDQAIDELNAIQGGASQAEWNFLMGSAFYYKGWLNEALRYFSTACRLAPGNREYEAALRSLQTSQNGQMPNNPYGGYGSYGAPGTQTMSCSCCDMCMAMMCMDTCCSCCGGF